MLFLPGVPAWHGIDVGSLQHGKAKGKWLLSSGLRSCWKSEGKAKWEGGRRLLLMEGKTRKIQVSGSIRVGCGREKASSRAASGRDPAAC